MTENERNTLKKDLQRDVDEKVVGIEYQYEIEHLYEVYVSKYCQTVVIGPEVLVRHLDRLNEVMDGYGYVFKNVRQEDGACVYEKSLPLITGDSISYFGIDYSMPGYEDVKIEILNKEGIHELIDKTVKEMGWDGYTSYIYNVTLSIERDKPSIGEE